MPKETIWEKGRILNSWTSSIATILTILFGLFVGYSDLKTYIVRIDSNLSAYKQTNDVVISNIENNVSSLVSKVEKNSNELGLLNKIIAKIEASVKTQ